MTPPSTGALVSGIAVAALLSAGAVTVVAETGCDDPGSYAQHEDGVLELVGGCLVPADLVVSPDPGAPAPPSAPGPGAGPVLPATVRAPPADPGVTP